MTNANEKNSMCQSTLKSYTSPVPLTSNPKLTSVAQLQYFKIQLKTIDITTRLLGKIPTNSTIYSPETYAEVYCSMLNFQMLKLAISTKFCSCKKYVQKGVLQYGTTHLAGNQRIILGPFEAIERDKHFTKYRYLQSKDPFAFIEDYRLKVLYKVSH